MTGLTEDTALIRHAIAYVIELLPRAQRGKRRAQPRHAEPGGRLHPRRPELRLAVKEWGERARTDEATTSAAAALPFDEAYRRIGAFLAIGHGTAGLRPAQRSD